jgi:hypothetical protein
MHRDSLGLLYHLLHVETLLLSSISKEDSELVELNAVPEDSQDCAQRPLCNCPLTPT